MPDVLPLCRHARLSEGNPFRSDTAKRPEASTPALRFFMAGAKASAA